MQLQFWLDNDNRVVVDLQLSSVGNSGSESGPEVTAAIISDTKLSHIKADELLDIAGQALDHLEAGSSQPAPQADWREAWMAATKG